MPAAAGAWHVGDALIYPPLTRPTNSRNSASALSARAIVSASELATLFDPLTDQRELVRHYTLFDVDIAMIQRCRGDHNRLGYAIMLCY